MVPQQKGADSEGCAGRAQEPGRRPRWHREHEEHTSWDASGDHAGSDHMTPKAATASAGHLWRPPGDTHHSDKRKHPAFILYV